MIEKYEKILDDFKTNLSDYELVKEIADKTIMDCIKQKDIPLCIFESRVKDPKSLEGKLVRKGELYDSVWDLTDLVGTRIVTYYTHDVDRIAAEIGVLFDIDKENSDDKRSIQTGDSFGYLSLHLICSIPKSLYYDLEHPGINRIRFEIQIRTLLQHMWAATQHDTGYKSDVDIPAEYRRRYSRLAGLLELADEEYSNLYADVQNYRKSVRKLVETYELNSLGFNKDTFDAYMSIDTDIDYLEKLSVSFNRDLVKEPYDFFYDLIKDMGVKTIMDVETIRLSCQADAYRLAMVQLSESDPDSTISSNIMTEAICLIYYLKNQGLPGLTEYYAHKNGTSEGAEECARECIRMAQVAGIDF